ncbi:SecY-interacting protein [Celerinatantimonas sp. YJH-8]|uniref:SecY-interacting protein n=1 Tax=Celerinatantimonas sp. YJH-8 TaxID=3228714 RepID=UPI0038C22D68
MTISAVEQAFDQFIERCQLFWQQHHYPQVEHDELWPSPCETKLAGAGYVFWQPVLREQSLDFSTTEDALDMTFNEGVKAFLGRYYSDSLSASFQGLDIELVQAWNESDSRRLQENLIAHILMQRRLRQPETLFIASCEDDLQVVSVLNTTGEVVLETLGRNIRQPLAPDLVAFLGQLEPTD